MKRLDGVLGGGANVDFDSQVRPWLGKEAALAVLTSTGASARHGPHHGAQKSTTTGT